MIYPPADTVIVKVFVVDTVMQQLLEYFGCFTTLLLIILIKNKKNNDGSSDCIEQLVHSRHSTDNAQIKILCNLFYDEMWQIREIKEFEQYTQDMKYKACVTELIV